MNWDEFADWGARASEWARDYHRTLPERPVRAQTKPGDIHNALPPCPPERAEPMDDVFQDFQDIVVPGMTHWQHPRFFAYFNGNAAPASALAEVFTAAMAPICLLWQTSPAATEMEARMTDWLRQSLGLPEQFQGVIQEGASLATLTAALTMRERALDWEGNRKGLAACAPLRIYSSAEAHTSVDRAAWIAGIGDDNLVRVPTTGPQRGIDPMALEAAILADLAAGYTPAGVILSVGGTGTGAIDPIADCIKVAQRHGLYTHVDAAWAGSAMICPEFRDLWDGIELADSLVFNPHKWLGVQFDCSVHFLRDPALLSRTLSIQPEFLKTHGADGIVNYSEWTIPLGRRFRALKVWFVMRCYGLEGLRVRIRNHIKWSQHLCTRFKNDDRFEILTEPVLSLFTFRCKGNGQDLDALNLALVNAINDDGRIYLTQTRVGDHMAIRFQAGQFDCTEQDVMMVYDVISEITETLI